ncbi:hypothetical protein LTR84_006258 [Exophiala bonariae]|uniref:RGS domain-containing protein n=1 Tax=Exophiala bonariae TaxID=1690606 RepID=A0AAV9N5Y7_9EURO|nr:hypothetical protein LTR84_006258 [Exophiala bonariae]
MSTPIPPCNGGAGAPRTVVDKGATIPDLPQYAQGYDGSLRYNTDGLGMTYISIVVVWTCLLLPAIIFLLKNRDLPYLRMRNIPLAVSAVATLHVYWILCLIAYVLNGYFPCTTEYWIMSIYLPLGIALFQASNSQLLSIATAQKEYIQGRAVGRPQAPPPARARGLRKYWQRLREYNATKNTMAWIGIGMVLQVAVALIVFLTSRQFRRAFGNSQSAAENLQCRRGWEWWPSIAWQLFWAWIYAPILLWRVRNIRDVHGWRSQTVVCIVAGLPASPMWLIALYAPGMRAADFYFIPPMWFSISIVLMQGCMIFVPFFQVFKNRSLETETREIIAEWEQKQKSNGSVMSESTKSGARSRVSTRQSIKTTASNRHCEMYTMGTLEKTLQLNPQPLLMFSATKDFSAENISFLIHVKEWKANWASKPPKSIKSNKQQKAEPAKVPDKALVRQQFQRAVGIYASFISLKYSDFPINISSQHLRDLEAIFEQYAALVCARPAPNAATPFDNFWSSTVAEDLESQPGRDQLSVVSTITEETGRIEDRLISDPTRQLGELKMTNFGERLPDNIGIPYLFDPTVFDKAESSIKELVLTNTWAKFVKAGFAQQEKQGVAAKLQETIEKCRIRFPRRRYHGGDTQK